MKRLTITFRSGQPADFYARAFWFAESLHSPIVHAGLGTLSDIDKIRDILWIDVKGQPQHGQG